jgi:hypothetical protein
MLIFSTSTGTTETALDENAILATFSVITDKAISVYFSLLA